MLTFKFREDTLDGTLLHRAGQFMCQAKQTVQLMGAITIKQASIPSQRCSSNSHCPNGMADIMIAIPGRIQNHPQKQQIYSSTLKDPGILGLGFRVYSLEFTSPYRDQDRPTYSCLPKSMAISFSDPLESHKTVVWQFDICSKFCNLLCNSRQS